MPRDGSGAYSRAVPDYVFDTVISETDVNAEMDDIAAALTASLAKNGETTPTGNLPMGGFKHTGVADGTARTHYASLGQLQDGKVNWSDGGGTADAITATYSPTVTGPSDGQLFFVRATAANATTTPTFSPNGLTARTIVKQGGAALVAGEIAGDGHELILRYDSSNTRYELLNPKPSHPSLLVGSATGGDQGAGTVNAVAVYDDGHQLYPLRDGLGTYTALSGTAADVTGIRSDARRITVLIKGASTSGTNGIIVQLGDSGGIEATGYTAMGYTMANSPAIGIATETTGFLIHQGAVAAHNFTTTVVLTLADTATNLWLCQAAGMENTTSAPIHGAGSKATSATLDRIRITTIGGSDTFDAGSFNVLVE